MRNGTGLKCGTANSRNMGPDLRACRARVVVAYNYMIVHDRACEDIKMNKLVVFRVYLLPVWQHSDIVYILKKIEYHPSTSKTKSVDLNMYVEECEHCK